MLSAASGHNVTVRPPVAARAVSTSIERFLVAALAALGAATTSAAPLDACYVRADTVTVGEGDKSETRPAQSHLGLRAKSTQLFELDISVAGAEGAVCTLGGVAKVRGDAGRESLSLVVRPDPGRKSGRSGTLCQVFVQLTPSAIELATTQTSCQAQALCGGQVDLNGQRFARSTQLPAGSKGPCFEAKVP